MRKDTNILFSLGFGFVEIISLLQKGVLGGFLLANHLISTEY